MKYSAIQIQEKTAERICLEQFNIKGVATTLPGEIDFNFKIKTKAKAQYILKISRPDADENELDFQQSLLNYIAINGPDITAPRVICDTKDNLISTFKDDNGNIRYVRLLTWVSGRILNHVNPQLEPLRYSLGETCGKLTKVLQGFNHTKAHREFDWDVAQSLWTSQHIDIFSSEEKELVSYFQNEFKNGLNTYETLRKSVVHNDANDFNVIVSSNLETPTVIAAIDYGDAIHTQIINDLAITCAYAIMHHNDPLDAVLPIIKGYHSVFPLEENELAHLYNAIAMRLVISITKSGINKIKEPDNSYLLISEKPAWELLKKWRAISSDFAHYSFRKVCDYSAHPNENKFNKWASKETISIQDIFPSVSKNSFQPLDLSVSSTWVGHQDQFNDLDFFQYKINALEKHHPNKCIAGGYLEPRAIYTSSDYDAIGNYGRKSRTTHLGVDFWLPKNTPVHTLLDGEIYTATFCKGSKNYGGLIILKHRVNDFEFFSLYGHLSQNSVANISIGKQLKKGDYIGDLGDRNENGNWVPHLHFQLMLSVLDFKNDFPGVAFYNEIEVWKSICPNPNLLFKSEGLQTLEMRSNEALIDFRKQHLGKSLSLQYKTPIKMVRGAGAYLIDQYGQKYLDTVNNVAHVGHEHYEVVKAGQQQMALINTNSRYLHNNIETLAKTLLETLPPELNVLHFVNSGSEANELALRMAKATTKENDCIASEFGYHGNSAMCINISSYKFDGKGGEGAPEYTHIFPLPDTFRGKYKGSNTAKNYAEEVQLQIDTIHKKGRGVAAFIIEPIISCGGQVELPKGFLKLAYEKVRTAGGVCISDEVQTGCGRLGKTFWGFQLHDVTPDIVTIGKPLGNGHPVAAVACTQVVADAFANGMEYFNTFGGNPVSCAIATRVLETVKQEKLQENALEVGTFLKTELKKLAEVFPIIGNVRGQGLFLGIEFVDSELTPLPKQTEYLANRMKDHGILMSTDGPDHNVLKIKPPIVFSKKQAKELLFYFEKVMREDVMMVV